MDYPLGVQDSKKNNYIVSVLIPILMDYPLGVGQYWKLGTYTGGLNPYSNGLPSRGPDLEMLAFAAIGS